MPAVWRACNRMDFFLNDAKFVLVNRNLELLTVTVICKLHFKAMV